MARIELRMLDCTTDERYIKTEVIELYSKKAIKIDVYDVSRCEIFPIILDKSTAIKFAKTLRTEINKIQ